jgi:hypothetical protein
MSKAKPQSLGRAIKRGNAVVSHDKVTNSLYYTYKKGSTRRQWILARQNRVSELPEESFNPIINNRRAKAHKTNPL